MSRQEAFAVPPPSPHSAELARVLKHAEARNYTENGDSVMLSNPDALSQKVLHEVREGFDIRALQRATSARGAKVAFMPQILRLLATGDDRKGPRFSASAEQAPLWVLLWLFDALIVVGLVLNLLEVI